MKILVDMNLSPRWVSVLVTAGFEAKHWSVLGTVSSPDSQILAFAQAFGVVLATTGRLEPSVVQIRTPSMSPDRNASDRGHQAIPERA